MESKGLMSTRGGDGLAAVTDLTVRAAITETAVLLSITIVSDKSVV